MADVAIRHALPVLGARPLSAVKPSEVQAFVRGLTDKGLAPSTVRVVVQHVRAMFRAAEHDRLIPRSPCERLVLPRVARTTIEPLSTEAVPAIRDGMPEHLRALVTFAAGTGLRPPARCAA